MRETFIHRPLLAQTFFPDFTARIMRFTLLAATLPRLSRRAIFLQWLNVFPGFRDAPTTRNFEKQIFFK